MQFYLEVLTHLFAGQVNYTDDMLMDMLLRRDCHVIPHPTCHDGPVQECGSYEQLGVARDGQVFCHSFRTALQMKPSRRNATCEATVRYRAGLIDLPDDASWAEFV